MTDEFRGLPLEDEIEALEDVGILDEDGVLSERYGGPGKRTARPCTTP